jgi:2'-5' RNA ligase
MPRLFTVSYPEIPAEAGAFISAFRKRHDLKHRDVVEAHFTMVFGCDALGHTEYVNHVAAVSAASHPISFKCKYAMLGADDEDETAYVFLVPDEGYAAVSMLHDSLYTGPLLSRLRLDLPYIPHITIGTLSSRTEAKALCDELNRHGVSVEGSLRSLAVGAIENGKFKNLSVHTLGEA